MDSPRSREVIENYKMTLRHQIKFRVTMRFLRPALCVPVPTFLLTIALSLVMCSAKAQDRRLIFGLGFGTTASTDDGFGFGFRGRMSTPVNADLSFAADIGVSAFFLGGRDDSSFAFDPQLSAIVTLPGERTAVYFLAGVGAYLSSGGTDGQYNGPTLHFGIGGARPLNDGVFFYELNPALVIKENSVGLAVPLRVGIII